MVPAIALGLGACKEKEAPTATSTPETETPKADVPKVETPPNVVAVPKTEPATPKVGPEERAAKLGFAKHLPQDTEVVMAFYEGSKTADRMKSSKLWKLVQGQMGIQMGDEAIPMPEMEDEDIEAPEGEQETAPEGEGRDLPLAGAKIGAVVGDPEDAAGTEPDPTLGAEGVGMAESAGPAVLFGKEFTIALGKSTGQQTGNLLTFNRRHTYFQMKAIAKAMATAAKSGDMSGMSQALQSGYSEEIMTELAKDPESGMTMLESVKIPPIYLAFKTSEADRAGAAQQVAAMVENLNEIGGMASPVKFDTAGVTFEGATILGSKIASSMEEGREEMDESLGKETVDRMIAAIAKKDLVVVSGVVSDYVVMFIGGSNDDLKLAESVGQSMVANEALSFADGYLSKDLAAIVYSQKDAVDSMIAGAGGMSDITNGFRDGLAGSDGLGNTRDLEAMFQIVGEREAALRKLAINSSSGTVAFFEQGLKVESYGGMDNGMIDWKASNKLARLGESEDVLMVADLSVDSGYDEKSRAYVEALMETAYAVAMKVSELPMEEGEMAQFKSGVKMFDEKFRADFTALWDAVGNDFHGSLGQERALVVDLKGSAPAVPGVPQVVVDKAKMPRISFVAPVTDRTKLSESWTKMDATLKTTLGKISELTSQDIPMQKPLSSEKDGAITWFFPMPFFNDDFLPSVTLTDKWFVASSSKNQALDLIKQANTPGEGRDGLWFSMNFKTLEKYANETYELANENAEALMGQPFEPEQQKLIKDAIGVLGDLDKLTVHTRKEGAVLRSSVHFKTR